MTPKHLIIFCPNGWGREVLQLESGKMDSAKLLDATRPQGGGKLDLTARHLTPVQTLKGSIAVPSECNGTEGPMLSQLPRLMDRENIQVRGE